MPNFTPVDYDPFMGAAEAAPNLFPADRPLGDISGAPNLILLDRDPSAGASTQSLIPVDHDPFADNPAAAPRLIPVDYDPFGGAAAGSLIPVDHNSFADNPSAAPKLIPVDYDPFAAATSPLDGQQAGWNPQPANDTDTLNLPDLTQPKSPQSATSNYSSPGDFNSQPTTQPDTRGLFVPTIYRQWPIPSWGPFPVPPLSSPQTLPGLEEWNKNAQEGIEGLFNFFRRRGGSGGGGRRSDEDDYCYKRWEREDDNCKAFQGFGTRTWKACKDRAVIRWDLCNRNGGKPSLDEPPEYSWNDIPRGMRPDD
jgi:hypothetical protein